MSSERTGIARDGPAKPERVLSGLAVSPGIAVGSAHIPEMTTPTVSAVVLAPEAVAAELERLAEAVALSRRQLAKLKDKSTALPGSAAEEVGYLLEAHLAMLADSRLVRGAGARIESLRLNAEAAVEQEIEALSEAFRGLDDPYLAARIDDIRVVGGRLIRNLTHTPFAAFGKLAAGTVLLADEITPADTALMDPARIAGFASVLGGAEGHTAIMARALGIPAVLGCAGLLSGVDPGDPVIVNGTLGTVTLNPTAATLAVHVAEAERQLRERHSLDQLQNLPAVTRDGVDVVLEANLELAREIEQAAAAGARGLGLVRTEFLYMNRDDLPGEDEQTAAFLDLVRGMKGRPVTIRTLDIGGDKLASTLSSRVGDSPNPALGLRAIRLSLSQRGLLETQLAAILRAGVAGPVRILLPMITTLSEVRATRSVLLETAARLRAEGLPIAEPLPPLGIMIEVPAAALAADAFAREVDFFALGTNDLTQYALAIDRGDEQVAHLYNPLHPAVLRLIQFTAEAALRRSIPISVCGEIAGDPRYTALLLGLGITTLSMAPRSLPRVKQRVRCINFASARRVAAEIMAMADDDRIAGRLDDYNALL